MTKRHLGIAGAVLAGLLSTASVPAHAEDTLHLGHNRAWSDPALILGLANHDFSAFGVDVAEQEFTNPADIVTAIISGDLDAGAAPAGTVFTAVTRGAKVKAVAVLQGSNNPPIAFTVRTDSGIASVEDLRGKTLGVNNYGGNHDIYLRYWLTRGSLDPEKDVNIIVVPVPSMIAALVNKQVDLVPLAAFDQVIAAQRYPGKTKTLFDYADVLKAGIGKNENAGIVLVMSDHGAKRPAPQRQRRQPVARAPRLRAGDDAGRAARHIDGVVPALGTISGASSSLSPTPSRRSGWCRSSSCGSASASSPRSR